MSFGTAYATKKRCMAKGGEVRKELKKAEDNHPGVSGQGAMVRLSNYHKETGHADSRSSMKSAKDMAKMRGSHSAGMPGPTSGVSGFADGGDVSEHEQDADMIARIMQKRKEYARGGEVANDVGVAEADELPAEFDDLVLRDDLDGAQPVDSNEEGDSDVSDDPIDRIMLKRKKDKLPRPA